MELLDLGIGMEAINPEDRRPHYLHLKHGPGKVLLGHKEAKHKGNSTHSFSIIKSSYETLRRIIGC